MILEFNLDYRCNSLVYEKIFLEQLKEANLNGNISKNHFNLKLFVEAQAPQELEDFATTLAQNLPHSIFLYDSQVSVVESMPKESYTLPKDNYLPSPPCPKCLPKIKESYNIFTHCDICGYGIDGIERSYQNEFQTLAKSIQEGQTVGITTMYGNYSVGVLSKQCNNINFDIVAYDIATIEKYSANIEPYEIKALASIEKPSIKFKKNIKFIMDFEDIEADLIRFRVPDDAILVLLMQELHKVGIDALFISKDAIETHQKFALFDIKEELEPIEVVTAPNNVLIVKGNRGLAPITINTKEKNSILYAFDLVEQEHNLKANYENIAGVNLAKEYSNNIVVYGEKYGLIEYLSFDFEFQSIADIFEQIKASDTEAQKLLENYQNKFPKHYDKISTISFDTSYFNLYKLWGVIAIILDITPSSNPIEGAKALEQNALSFLGEKGPRIDYKLFNKKGKVYFNPLMTIRTAMSFRLAGVDESSLCYGVIESFLEFIANELDELKQSMGVSAIIATGSLLSNKKIFSKMSQEVSVNHKIYFAQNLNS